MWKFSRISPATLEVISEATMNVDYLHNLAMSDNGFIFDPKTGHSYNANETGFFILKLFQQGLTRDEIIANVLDLYEITQDTFERDFDHFVMQLRSLGLVGV